MCGLVVHPVASERFDATNGGLREMLDRVHHRDDAVRFHHVPNQALFGHKRLAIIDLDHMPSHQFCR